MKYYSSIIALALGTVAFQAQAQDAAAPPPDQDAPAPASTDATAEPAAPSGAVPAATAGVTTAATTPVTDQEVDSFAQATVKVQQISADATLDQTAKQQQMATAVKGAGLDPARYNQIGHAIASDTALRARIQTAMAKYAAPPKG